MTQEMPKYYIAETYRHFRHWCHEQGIKVSDRYFIGTDRIDRLKGLELRPEQVKICYDPRAPWSFWCQLAVITARQ